MEQQLVVKRKKPHQISSKWNHFLAYKISLVDFDEVSTSFFLLDYHSFYAQLTSTVQKNADDYSSFIYSSVKINIGAVYSSTTGIFNVNSSLWRSPKISGFCGEITNIILGRFTAPRQGLYFFSCDSVQNNDNGILFVVLQRNGTTTDQCEVSSGDDDKGL